MLVYGDPQFVSSFSDLKRRLWQQIKAASPDSLDDLRCVLIQCGQMEQALADAFDKDRSRNAKCIERVTEITEAAAMAFYMAWRDMNCEFPTTRLVVGQALEKTDSLLRQLLLPDFELTVKVPEGFAFYGLFPEQYCATTLDWAPLHQRNLTRSVLVVGIRSIGTTLSAIISVILKTAGNTAARLTVRPEGDPFCRVCKLHSAKCAPEHAIVVDEGPGLSGSSMSSVADALMECGFSRNQISFFPGHRRGPGSAASEHVRANWQSIRQFFTPLDQVHWGSSTLELGLASKASELMGEACCKTQNFSQGGWRKENYDSESDWPEGNGVFEKMKWRCSSSGDSIIWKFVGLGPWLDGTSDSIKSAWSQLIRRADAQDTPRPLEIFRGFIALTWITGKPLNQEDLLNPTVICQIADYLARTASPPLSKKEEELAVNRLRDMLVCNAEESLGLFSGQNALRYSQKANELEPVPSFADGDVAPHNWIRSENGKIFKVGGSRHDLDHTLVGRQPLYWAAAGVLVESDANELNTSRLCSALANNGIRLKPSTLAFYCAAYSAFRIGQTAICTEWEPAGSAEWLRLQNANGYYRSSLASLLG